MQNEENEALRKEFHELKAMLQQFLPKQDTFVAKEIIREIPLSKEEGLEIEEEARERGDLRFGPSKTYDLPNTENKLLNNLDLQHVQVLEESKYLKCRTYYVRALKDVAKELQSVFDNPDTTVVKSTEIKKLIEIWK